MRRSIIPGGNNRNRCFLCFETPTDRHHCMYGTANRAKAEEWGLTVYLCPECHRKLHDQGLNARFLKQVAQQAFEEKYDHELWMREFGRNYL